MSVTQTKIGGTTFAVYAEVADHIDALRAEAERLRGLLLRVNDADRHLEDGAYWVRLYYGDFEDIRAALADQPDSAPAAPERRACTCLYPTPAKYVPDFCGMCHGRITSTAPAAPLCPYCGMPDCGYTGGECVAETVDEVRK